MGEHPSLKNLYKQVVSGSFGWDRWGLLGVLADGVLNYVSGDILEIGCGESSIILSKLAEKYNRTCYHVEYSKSGVENMKNTEGYFGKNSVVFNGKSDDFFSKTTQAFTDLKSIALAFIDGSHEYEYVSRDFWNTGDYLSRDGVIVIHDSYPPDKSWTKPERCGDVYRLRIELENSKNWDIFTFPFSAFNVGLSIIRKRGIREWENDL